MFYALRDIKKKNDHFQCVGTLARVIIFRFNSKIKLSVRCFCHFTAAMLVPLGSAPTWRLDTKLYKFGRNTFPNNVRVKKRIDLQ